MPHPRITTLVRPANGSSQPWFCDVDDGSRWLVKFIGAGPGREALVAEYLASGLGRLWELPIPECQPILLDHSVARAGTDEFWDVLAASQGMNLGVREIPDAEDVIPDDRLTGSVLTSMRAFDALMSNWDRTAQSRNLLRDETGKLWWIDHGSCRFLHRLDRAPELPSNHFLAGETVEASRFPTPERSAVHDLVAGVPNEWLEQDRALLADALCRYLAAHCG